MDFIFMLTRDDQTVEDALEVLEAISPLGLRHIGFKDKGVPPEVLQAVNRSIKAQGAISYLEVVATTPEASLSSVRVGLEIGVDRLLGGTEADAALQIRVHDGRIGVVVRETTPEPVPDEETGDE